MAPRHSGDDLARLGRGPRRLIVTWASMTTTVRCPVCGNESLLSAIEPGQVVVCRCGLNLDTSSILSLGFPRHDANSDDDEADVPPAAASLARLGKYRIIRPIGYGGFGTVYLAECDDPPRAVALKVASPEVQRKTNLVRRFLQEYKAASRVRHEGVVEFYEADTIDGISYLALEYIEGRTLTETLKDGLPSFREAARIAIAIGEALAYLHAAGVVHRDIKPSNVMIRVDGAVKLIDFGLARFDASNQTMDRTTLGTPIYMSPEQADGRSGDIHYPSDQYSLGVILYEMLCGEPPFRAENHNAVIYKILNLPVPPPSTRRSSIPQPLELICLTALAKDPGNRYPSCRQFVEALARWLAETAEESGETPAFDDPSAAAVPDDFEEPDPANEIDANTVGRETLHHLVRASESLATSEARNKRTLDQALNDAQRRRDAAKEKSNQLFKSQSHQTLTTEERERHRSEDRRATLLARASKKLDSDQEMIANLAAKMIRDVEESFSWQEIRENAVLEVDLKKLAERRELLLQRVERAATTCRQATERFKTLTPRLKSHGLGPPELRVIVSRKRPRLRELTTRVGRVCLALDDIEARIGKRRNPLIPTPRSVDPAWLADRYNTAIRNLARAKGLVRRFRQSVTEVFPRREARLRAECAERIKDLAGKRDLSIAQIETKRENLITQTQERFEATCKSIRDEFGNERAGGGLDTLRDRHRTEQARFDKEYEGRVAAARAAFAGEQQTAERRWHESASDVLARLAEVRAVVDRVNPPWDAPRWSSWRPPRTLPRLVRFGQVKIVSAMLSKTKSADKAATDPLPAELFWPAVIDLPSRPNVLIVAPAAGRAPALNLVQSLLMRLLTTFPPGKLRLNIIDPEGIGHDFRAFHHLADSGGILGPIRVEPPQIDELLGDLCGHLEKISQSFLQDEHETINELNNLAGEIAEPYRILVINDFPRGFQGPAFDRLARIVSHGPRCGVLTYVIADPQIPLPPGFTLDTVASRAVRFLWRNNQLEWEDSDFGRFPLQLDPPPPQRRTRELIRRIGEAGEAASRVEVPFEFIIPPIDQWWTADSRSGVDVPLGKVGPGQTHSLQLGRNTLQHVLIAGRTGSGKSSLLHALITNLALTYSPEQIELYLIDFKKGVEFKPYAAHELPHARVIAIESEREFGLSVLKRLDAELNERGDRFKAAGVDHIRGYREIKGLPVLPRILLIVDEFQEFFTEDDTIAREVALLLDRLVRQGRAFGMHVVLGTQTLSGAYTLGRSTFSQMAVRIALQCDDSDAPLILNEENNAARLLSRPGEAVYNNQSGMAEANHFFQVAWLPEKTRADYLTRIRRLAEERGWRPPRRLVVFEGDDAAALPRNARLAERLAGRPAPPGTALAWLGESIALKDPTAALFRRRPSNHLLVVGHGGSASLGVMTAAVLSLAAHHGPDSARFYILDGTPHGAPESGILARVADTLPQTTFVRGIDDIAAIVTDLATEVQRRIDEGATDEPTYYLVIHDLVRFRDLRRNDDLDYLNPREKDSAAAHFELLLRDGSAVGIHVIAWSDGMNTISRFLSRSSLREFSTRVAFQMGENDSVNLLGTPQASRLGPHRALFLDEEQGQGQAEKFRPYSPPPREWLAWIKDQYRGLVNEP